MKTLWASKALWLTLLVSVGLAGLGWSQRQSVLAWYHIRQLTGAYQDNREECARRVADLGEAALPGLLEGLHDGDAIVCGNMQAALEMMLKSWGGQDPRTHATVQQLHAQFEQLSTPGQEKTILLLTAFLQQKCSQSSPAAVTSPIGELMLIAVKKDELRPIALLLAAELLERAPAGPWAEACRAFVLPGLYDPQTGTRIASVRLLLRPPLRQDKALLAKVVPLLSDKEPAVRRVALLALAAETELAREDLLVPMLHDEDVEVQYLSEQALRARGLSDHEIQMARQISDRDPRARRDLALRLTPKADLNLAEWLQQMSRDESPGVRAAAARVAGTTPSVDFSKRLREMAERDPSDTVRQIAGYWLQQRQQNERRAALD